MVIVQSQALISGLDKGRVSLVSGGAQIVLFCSAGSFLFLLFFCLLISYLLSSWPVCAASCVFLWFVRSRSRSVGFVSMVHLVSPFVRACCGVIAKRFICYGLGGVRILPTRLGFRLPPVWPAAYCACVEVSRLSAVIGLCRTLWRPLAAAAE